MAEGGNRVAAPLLWLLSCAAGIRAGLVPATATVARAGAGQATVFAPGGALIHAALIRVGARLTGEAQRPCVLFLWPAAILVWAALRASEVLAYRPIVLAAFALFHVAAVPAFLTKARFAADA